MRSLPLETGRHMTTTDRSLEPYADARWTHADHAPGEAGSLWCRGNVGEVFPNVVTPLSSSLYLEAIARAQAQASVELGFVTRRQYDGFRATSAWLTGIFGGYLYGNVSLARTAVARAPGLTVEMLDQQMFGLSDAPPHRRGRGERNPRAAWRTTRFMVSTLRRPDDGPLRRDRADVAAYAAATPELATATIDTLSAVARSVQPFAERLMRSLLIASARAGFGRIMLERVLGAAGTEETVNRLTSGLGTIESAEPADALWSLARMAAADRHVTDIFDTGLADLAARLAADAHAAGFLAAYDAFRDRHGARGPDEWELASPTWGSDPAIGLAVIDRLRHVPDENDPARRRAALAAERDELARVVRSALPRARRPVFDRAMRSAASGAGQREATKAAFVRALYPARRALAELARRSGLAHDDFFVLTIDETPTAVLDASAWATTIAERRARRDHLQARVPPFWFEGTLPPPSTWAMRNATAATTSGTRRLTGLGVCAGVATGRARIVTNPAEPGALGPGDILVAPLTDPAWTPLFLAAAGVVVDVGAQMSHAAIVARELGIPAVVSVTGASTTIADGTLVTVDGSAGTVTVHGDDG